MNYFLAVLGSDGFYGHCINFHTNLVTHRHSADLANASVVKLYEDAVWKSARLGGTFAAVGPRKSHHDAARHEALLADNVASEHHLRSDSEADGARQSGAISVVLGYEGLGNSRV